MTPLDNLRLFLVGAALAIAAPSGPAVRAGDVLIAGAIAGVFRAFRLLQLKRWRSNRDTALGDAAVGAGAGAFAVIAWHLFAATSAGSSLGLPASGEIVWGIALLAAYVGPELVFSRAWRGVDASLPGGKDA